MVEESTEKGSFDLQKELRPFWNLIQISLALGLVYTVFAELINQVNALLDAGLGIFPRWIIIDFPWVVDPWGHFVNCVLIAVVAYFIVIRVCHYEWVLEKVDIVLCWRGFVIFNPWTWVLCIVCTVIQIYKWVLRLFCQWFYIPVWALVIVCFIHWIF